MTFVIPGTVQGAVKVQGALNPAGPWTDLGDAHDLGSILRSRRFAMGPTAAIQARYLRVVKVGSFDWQTTVFQLGGTAAWVEKMGQLTDEEIAAVRIWNFNFDDATQRYTMVATDGNLEVFNAGQRVASAISPWTAAQLPFVNRAQALDTLLACHPDVAPQRIMRQGAHTEWDTRNLKFDALPLYDYDGTNAGATDEVQQITLTNFAGGDTWQITLEGETTSVIPYSAVGATQAASIKSALEGLDSIGAGNTIVTNTSANVYSVEFTGALKGQNIGQMAPAHVNSANGVASGATLTEGKQGGEPVISATRGWPGACTFYQQRLWLSALKSRPETLLGSGVGVYYNFNLTPAQADGSVDETMATNEVTSVVSVYPGQNLQIFTSAAEYCVPNEPIEPPVAIKQMTRRGAKAGVPQFSCSNEFGGTSTLFVGVSGDAIYQFGFTFATESYVAPNLAIQAAHIVRGIIDAGWRRHLSTDHCDMGVFIKDDGDAVVMLALRDQDICGFMPWTTAGEFLAAGCELNGDMYLAIARVRADGTRYRTLEKLDDSRMLDCSQLRPTGVATVNVLGQFAGKTVTLWLDGQDAGDVLVTDTEAVPLPFIPQRSCEVGLLFTPIGTTMPGVLQQDPRAGGTMHPRVGDIAFRLGPTANLHGGIPGGKLWKVPLKKRVDTLLDQGDGEAPFSGWTKLEAVPGFRDDAQVYFAQPRPGPLQILEIVLTVTT